MRYDIEIDGKGFYQIVPATKRAATFMRQVQGYDGHVAYSDQTDMTQDIADGAVAEGLHVRVNGRLYLGNNRVA